MDTIFDFMDVFEDFLILLNRYGVSTADARYFPAYREFCRLRREGCTYYGSLETVSELYGWPVGTLRTKFRIFSQRLG